MFSKNEENCRKSTGFFTRAGFPAREICLGPVGVYQWGYAADMTYLAVYVNGKLAFGARHERNDWLFPYTWLFEGREEILLKPVDVLVKPCDRCGKRLVSVFFNENGVYDACARPIDPGKEVTCDECDGEQVSYYDGDNEAFEYVSCPYCGLEMLEIEFDVLDAGFCCPNCGEYLELGEIAR